MILGKEVLIMSLTTGLKGRSETTVTDSNTAASIGSGLLPVFATPMMVALMENAAVKAVQGVLEPGQGTVGVHMDVSHDAATPTGMKVWAEAELTEAEGRRLTFSVAAYDEAGRIGKGVHQRVVIQNERFLAKARKKLEAGPL